MCYSQRFGSKHKLDIDKLSHFCDFLCDTTQLLSDQIKKLKLLLILLKHYALENVSCLTLREKCSVFPQHSLVAFSNLNCQRHGNPLCIISPYLSQFPSSHSVIKMALSHREPYCFQFCFIHLLR